MMRGLLRAVAAALLLSGCAYKPLKAPCSPDEGGAPLAYAPSSSQPVPEPFRSLDACGPMRRI
ncbi:hypothetical protein [Lichenifustis flavocetrariae]|uniref:Lipoprotein n=1 Tax=Lichenifustis flavocetrariae TaxID=2949735 RepID=A0AA41ZAX5_9HYPH|nr:hypothetical protein [Lichenifustis flavocetrariae]MCW6512537.1 hypothetical protein [Lichenifustis flavocetrariae]